MLAAKDGDAGGVAKAGIDLAMGALAFTGPIGFGISVAYFIVDQTVGWSWLKPVDVHPNWSKPNSKRCQSINFNLKVNKSSKNA